MDPTGTLPPDLRDLDSAGVLDAVAACRRDADRAEASLVALAVHYVDLHPVTDQQPAASWDPDRRIGSEREPLAGAGTPLVAEYAVEALGAALGTSYRAALGLVAEAVELCYRLPRLWTLVQTRGCCGPGRPGWWPARKPPSPTAT